MAAQGKARFYRQEHAARNKGRYATRLVPQLLIQQHITAYTQKIEAFMVHTMDGKSGGKPMAAKFLLDLDIKVIAVIASHCILDLLYKKPSLRELSTYIGTMVQTEREFQTFSKKAPRYFQLVMKNLNAQNMDIRVKRHILGKLAEEKGWKAKTMEANDMILTGTKLVELFVEATGLVKVEKAFHRKRFKNQVEPTPALMAFVEEANKRLEGLKPVFGALVESPLPWEGLKEGGFHTLSKSFVRTRSKRHRELLEGYPMPGVYAAVNAIQETPYCINERVLDIALALRERGIAIAKLPERYDPALHGTPADWKQESFSKQREGMKHMMKNLECAMTLNAALTYRGEERFYFVHTLDFRGRAYPVTSYLSPQGKDLDRGLLTFADCCARPLGESGANWLAIHGANCFGHDKLPFTERRAWVEGNSLRIVQTACDPLVDYWWTEAEEPFQFLAFCFEWAGYMRQGEGYCCSLPVAVDGSNNALQHFSALLRDKDLGEATNMLPVDTPRDVYGEICAIINGVIEKDAAKGQEEALALKGKLTRKTVKTPVMTAYYGVTVSGMKEQIEEAFDEQEVEIKNGKIKAISYLVKLLREDVIPKKTPAVKPCMELLKEVTRILAQKGEPTQWTTPSGFLVVQDYRDYPSAKVRTKLFGQICCINHQIEDEAAKIKTRKQTDGISANFIHSLDSSAMMQCVLEAKACGVSSFRMIHDGFATVPADIEKLNVAIRKTFKQMYEKENLLKKFVIEALGEEEGLKLWEKANIQQGTLNLNLLMEAKYFFA